jgi:hypothetical protein
MLGLHCEKAGTTVPVHKDDICPEAWRKGKTKRELCTFRFNINAPPTVGIIHFTKAIAVHSHPLPEASSENTSRLNGLTSEEISIISQLAVLDLPRATILKVFIFAEIANILDVGGCQPQSSLR